MTTTLQEQLITKLNHMDEVLHSIREQLGETGKAHTDPRTVLKRTAGALSNVITGDIVAWQRRVRSEWE